MKFLGYCKLKKTSLLLEANLEVKFLVFIVDCLFWGTYQVDVSQLQMVIAGYISQL
jgi:hypothetical protein